MLVVFDLDFTLWDAGGTWCDHTRPPFRWHGDHIRDRDGLVISLYPDVKGILNRLNENDISMALASRTHSPGIATMLLEMFGVRKHFMYEQIFPGSKIRHFELLHEHSSIPYNQMIFFDDEHRNVMEVGNLGVHALLVNSGLSREEMNDVPGLVNLRF